MRLCSHGSVEGNCDTTSTRMSTQHAWGRALRALPKSFVEHLVGLIRCFNLNEITWISMDDSPRRKQWLVATAAILAVLTLYYYTGSWIIAALFLAAAGALIGYQARRGGKQSSHACLRCGATLNPNARQCNSCGSA